MAEGFEIIGTKLDLEFGEKINRNFSKIGDVASATTAANQAADRANTASDIAEQAIDELRPTIDNAEAATADALTAAETAEESSITANDAANNATLAAGSANTAATEANTAAASANQATTDATAATNSANTAASNANTAADTANASAVLADEATSNANTATASAVDATADAESATQAAEFVTNNFKRVGEFSASVTYLRGNEVGYNGSSYVALQETTGNLPTNTTFWALRAQRGVDGTGAVSTVNGLSPDESGNVEVDTVTDWSDLTGKPTEFTPAAHSHEISDVNGLQSELDSKGSQADIATLQEFATTHPAEDATLTKKGHVQLSSSVTSTSETLAATPKAVKTAMDRADAAFQSASDGKTAVASAVTAKGVAASPTDTFPTLATKIGQISTGKGWASGTTSFTGYSLIITGLPFTPKTFLAQTVSGGNHIAHFVMASIALPAPLRIGAGNSPYYSPTVTWNSDGLVISMPYGTGTFNWFAYE
ncbi:hypothetical protein KP77_24960 [Jeotgalibacillus alimentarius]|uniref:Uncharacterized protein n=1 Tax=Jeotgalibacillus alimentarius TaxID=135826 RepID=A0A0C2VSH0_9BACL|nr:phage tail protein [Jeotgalibacillus alimentarius]KIL46928.1 hypothetical protein KP77_24960 [Jeotgalibacillus alimentarius]